MMLRSATVNDAQTPFAMMLCPQADTNKKISFLKNEIFWWAFRDSNPGPTGYEPVALTN